MRAIGGDGLRSIWSAFLHRVASVWATVVLSLLLLFATHCAAWRTLFNVFSAVSAQYDLFVNATLGSTPSNSRPGFT